MRLNCETPTVIDPKKLRYVQRQDALLFLRFDHTTEDLVLTYRNPTAADMDLVAITTRMDQGS